MVFPLVFCELFLLYRYFDSWLNRNYPLSNIYDLEGLFEMSEQVYDGLDWNKEY